MKKSYLMIAAAVVLLTACMEQDALRQNANEQLTEQALSFSAFSNKVSKAGNSTALKDFYTVFGVYGWKTLADNTTNDVVFSNVANEYFTADDNGATIYKTNKPSSEWVLPNDIAANKGYWYYEDVRYWDKMATSYQFFAIAPFESNPTYTVAANANNISIATAASPYDISSEYNLARTDFSTNPISETAAPKSELTYSGFKKDYMIADKVIVDPKTRAANTDVTLLFHHILTKLNIKIQKSNDYKGQQILKVNKLEIANLAKKANFVYNAAGMTSDGWTKAAKTDAANVYSLTVNNAYSLANDATNYDQCYWIETLIFPQSTNCKAGGAQATADALTDCYLYIQYQIGSEVYNAYYDLAYVFDHALAPVAATYYVDGDDIPDGKQIGDEKTAAVPGGNFTFAQGSQYNLTMTVGPEPIHFAATVDDWDDFAETQLNID